jgi:hypothetical protein
VEPTPRVVFGATSVKPNPVANSNRSGSIGTSLMVVMPGTVPGMNLGALACSDAKVVQKCSPFRTGNSCKHSLRSAFPNAPISGS